MALAGEVGELVAEFQWLTPDESAGVMTTDPAAADRIRAEIGDVTNSLVRLASALGVDIIEAAHAKTDANERALRGVGISRLSPKGAQALGGTSRCARRLLPSGHALVGQPRSR